ncbi:uncharacterized protein LOC104583967 [Brachypodium distachyon]|uniref:uncharacterized protein LOC104583967 n=1 Tax=Brachypodium distachyon TaxID=15368 RepID=UPI00052FDD48|nr:uncharacterized protein LOC104583967 [Brachypodium distachyon]|eukprot:XP_010236318.1 uncharacterized protein LOC104583967 [Brachypodium distachyon]
MASEAIVSGVVGDMVGRAMLRRLLVRVESAVDAAGARRITSRALLAWLADLADAAHRGRHLLDAASRGDDEDGGSSGHADDAAKQVMSRSFSLPSSFNAAKRLRMAAGRLLSGAGHELDAVLADLEGFAGDIMEFVMLLQCCPPALHRPLLATGIYADSHMFGRHAERRRVLEFLLHNDEDGDRCSPNLGVLTVVGRAGLGKTTLVQNVCKEPAVLARFSLIMVLDFHCMSLMAAPGETALFLRSLFAASGTPNPNAINNVSDEQQLRLQLLEHKLRGERFLAVFDNVDARRRPVLDAILPALRRGGRQGSEVIVSSSEA